jgi:N-acetyltransferase
MTAHPFDFQPILKGEKLLIRPLREDDFEALYAVASDPEIWAMHPYYDRYKRDVFESFFEEAIASRGAFALIDKADGAIIGSSRYSRYDPDPNTVEIGWTFFACSHWRTGHNREAKALMINHALPHVDAIIFQIGATNFRSRTAVERLGAVLVDAYLRHYRGEAQDYVAYRLSAADARQGVLADQLNV